jgi:acetyl-CoA carboxylase biotin carboxyl carrier protein
MSHRVPRALYTGFDEHGEHEVIELHHNGVEAVLASVRDTAAELLTQSPTPPSTLTVRAGAVAVEMTWDLTTTVVAAPVPEATPAPEPKASTADVLAASTVGVFYRASSPGASPFVREGDHVVSGQQIGIIEAMKLMLPVEADRPGKIVEVLVKDGASVEFGQPLFRITSAES